MMGSGRSLCLSHDLALIAVSGKLCAGSPQRRNAMTTESVITDQMRAAIGMEGAPYTLEVDKTAVRMFARAVGYTDPLFYDEAFAKSKGYRSLPAPPH